MSDEVVPPLPPEPWPEGGVVVYTPKWAQHEGPVTQMAAQETGVVMRATARGVFVRYATDETPKLTDPADLRLLIRPGAYIWTPGDPDDLRDAWATEVGGWLSPEEADRLADGVAPHEFWLPDGYFSPACMAMVERNGDGEDCGLPAAHTIHTRGT